MMKTYFVYARVLAIRTGKAYSSSVPEKKGNEFSSSNHTKAHRPRNAAFSRAHVIASSMGGSGGDTFGYAGSFGVRSANPVICCPPHLAVGRSVTTHQRACHD